ncbi:TPA: hypothetical protein ACH3X1_005576 [Trebouxia sp. C0004]
MAAVAGSQPKIPTGKGCFKCGKSGHWSRDCTAPPSEWVARASTQPDGTPTQGHTVEAPLGEAPELQVPLATGKRKRQKPKLTVDNLKEQHGIAEVFHTFPKKFKQEFRGRGHEAGDLRRLLEMYIGWQQRIFPYAPFDAFIEGLEKLGSSYVLKMELRELRSEVLKVVDKPQQEGGWTSMGSGSAPVPGQDGFGGDGDDGMPEWDDDDLVAMQAEPMEPSRPTATAPVHQQSADMELDDDELLDMMGAMHADFPPPALLPASSLPLITNTLADDEFDDDELLELAQAGRSEEEGPSSHHATGKSSHDSAPAQHAKATALNSNSGQVGSIAEPQKSPAAEEQQPAGASAAQDDYLELDDDELLELACTSMQDNAHTSPGGISTVSKSAAERSRSDLPGVPQPGSRETNLGESGA